jgi:hypothetical protein
MQYMSAAVQSSTTGGIQLLGRFAKELRQDVILDVLENDQSLQPLRERGPASLTPSVIQRCLLVSEPIEQLLVRDVLP